MSTGLWIVVGVVVWFAVALRVATALGRAARDPVPPDAQERAAQATTRPHGRFESWPYGRERRW